MGLNRGQTLAVDGILENIYEAAEDEQRGACIIGEGGTGKTFCVMEIVREVTNNGGSILLTAPTNKAVKQLEKAARAADVMSDRIGFKTIHSALGLGLLPSAERKFVRPVKESVIGDYDIMGMDEASMANEVLLFNYMLPELEKTGSYPLLMGDNLQLPPVREDESKAFGLYRCYELTENQRQLNNPDGSPNGILLVAHQLRQAIIAKKQFTFDTVPEHNVEMVLDRDFMRTVLEGFDADTDLEQVRVLAWRNRRVDFINDAIRAKIYGPNAAQFEMGERVVTGGPVKDLNGDICLSTDEECIVAGVKESFIYDEDTGERWNTTCLTLRPIYADVKQVFAHVLHPSEQERYNRHTRKLSSAAESAKGSESGMRWRKFWTFVEMFADIKYCYCITLHRAQGSTFGTIYLDVKDLLENPKRSERQRLLYVGWSRPQWRLIINKLGFTA